MKISLFLATFIFTLAILSGCSTNDPIADLVSEIELSMQSLNAEMPWDFPSLHIDGIDNQEIHRREWLRDVSISISSTRRPQYNFEDATGRIRGRGNSSWGMEKRPYRIRFDHSYTRPMLNSGYAARDWTLIASHQDMSLMRHYSAYHFSELLGSMDFSPFARFVHLYFDGEYQGVYMLSDQIGAGEGRADLTYNTNPVQSEFLIQLNMRAHYNDAVDGVDFITVNGSQYDFRFPSNDDLTPEHKQYVIDHLTHIDNMIHSHDPQLFDYIDLPSFVDFYIINELYKDQDAGRFSVFLQLRGTGNNRRLEMGPVWDFDIAAGNAYYQGQPYHSVDGLTNESGYRPDGFWMSLENRWYRSLMLNPVFFEAVVDRWNEVREDQFPALIDHINFMATRYQRDFERNFQRWPILGVYHWPNPEAMVRITTFLGHVDYVTHFLTERAAWLEENLWTHDAWSAWEAYGNSVVSYFADRPTGYPTLEAAAHGRQVIPNPQFIDGGVGFNDDEGAASLFDDRGTATKYCADVFVHGPFWAVWRYDEPFIANRFIFATANDNESNPRRMGDGWTLSGSNDGENWTVLHTGLTNSYSNINHRFFYVDLDHNDQAFSYYQLRATQGGDSSIIQLSVVALTGE